MARGSVRPMATDGHDHHGHRRLAGDLLGNAAEQHPADARSTVAGDGDQIEFESANTANVIVEIP